MWHGFKSVQWGEYHAGPGGQQDRHMVFEIQMNRQGGKKGDSEIFTFEIGPVISAPR